MIVSQSGELKIADRLLTIDTGKLARQAHSSVTIRYGDTLVLATVCAGEPSRRGEESDFLRLTVDYEERHYAVGKVPGSFIRREGRPSEKATLSARLTDRSLRPLFPKGFSSEIQIIVTVLSADQENDPDLLAVIGGSAALSLSSLPFNGPVGAVRVGYVDDSLVLNPVLPRMNESLLDLVVVSTRDAIVMLEAGAKQVSEDILLEAIKLGHEANQDIIRLQEGLQRAYGRPKMEYKPPETSSAVAAAVSSEFGEKLAGVCAMAERAERYKAMEAVQHEVVDKLKDTFAESDILAAVDDKLREAARKRILETKLHLDGRQRKEIRPLSCEVGLLPRTHGSGLFTRGETQVLTITTLGSLRQEQMIDGLGLEETKRFMHHYNFPPYSTGEVKRLGSTSRREVGHGALAERALSAIIPAEDDFSYTIRLVSEVLSSNGSTSMGSVCAASLSLMDAGVPIKAPLAGIAMGLVTGDNDHVVLTDIEGTEDHYGDMDFKVAGTRQGITAIQLDIKLQGLSYGIVAEAIKQAREAHTQILDKIQETISSSRPELSVYAPRMYKMTIDQSKIGSVIGPGGKTIRSIVEETKATVDIENDGTVIIGSPNEEAAQKAIGLIEGLTRDVEVGGIYTGKVTRVMNFGAFVEILPGKEGLVHISELADYRVAKVEDVVQVGDEITVKVTEIDHLGRVNLSRRAVFGEGPETSGRREEDAPGHRPQGHPRPHQSRTPPGAQQRGGRGSRPRFADRA